jgi:FSR family fosmidomycin resistance protein-like MFS transporter
MTTETKNAAEFGPTDDATAEVGEFSTTGVLTIAAAHAVHDTYTAFLPPLLPLFIERLALTKTDAGILSALLQAPSLLQAFIGNLADRANLKFLVVLAPGVTATAMTLLGVSSSYGMLAVLLAVAGATSAGLHAVAPVMAGRLAGRRLGSGMGFWMVGGELGRTIGPVVAVTVATRFALPNLPWLMPAGWVASGLLLLRLRHFDPPTSRLKNRLPGLSAIRTMRAVMLPVAGIILVRAFVVSAITTFLPIYLNEEGASLFLSGASLTIVEAAGVLGALIGGSISDHIGRRWVLAVSMLLTPLLVFAFLESAGPARILSMIGMGLFGLSLAPVLMALVQESYPSNRALANGVYMALGFGIRSLVLVLLGMAADFITLRTTMLLSAGVMFLGLPLVLTLPDSKGRSPQIA